MRRRNLGQSFACLAEALKTGGDERRYQSAYALEEMVPNQHQQFPNEVLHPSIL